MTREGGGSSDPILGKWGLEVLKSTIKTPGTAMQIPGLKNQLCRLQVQKSATQIPGTKTSYADPRYKNQLCRLQVQKSAMQTSGTKISYAYCRYKN